MKLTPEQKQARLDAVLAWSANLAAAQAKGPVTPDELAAFVAAVTGKFADHYKMSGYTTPANIRIAVAEPGTKNARIVSRCPDETPDGYCAASAYCFVDLATGDILKPAGWKGPVKGARGNIRMGDANNWWAGALTPYGTAYLR